MEILIRDIRHGVRQLRSAPGITAVAVLCIALGVGANTAIFSLVNAMLLRPIAGVADPGELVEAGRHHRQPNRSPPPRLMKQEGTRVAPRQ